MPAKNIECQLVQGQVVRYLKGDKFSQEAVQQLEAHLAECGECSEIVANRRKTLLALLEDQPQAKAVVEIEKEEEKGITPRDRLVYAIARSSREANPKPETAVAEQPAQKRVITKPILYCSALAVVLVVMSYFSRGAMKLLGPTAAEAPVSAAPKPVTHKFTSVPLSSPPKPATPPPAPKPMPRQTATTNYQPDDLGFDGPAVAPVTQHHKRAKAHPRHLRRRIVRRPPTRHTRPHHATGHSSAVRVYAPDGHPLQ